MCSIYFTCLSAGRYCAYLLVARIVLDIAIYVTDYVKKGIVQ